MELSRDIKRTLLSVTVWPLEGVKVGPFHYVLFFKYLENYVNSSVINP